MKNKMILLVPILGLLASCAQDSMSGDVYSRNEARMGQSVQYGRVTNVRYVKIEGGNQMGGLAGAVAGGVLGSNIGNGRASNQAGAIGGALVGSMVGSQVQQAAGSRQGMEITVRLDSGGSVAVVQEVNRKSGGSFNVGDRVRVINSGGAMRVAY
jgi:outer membrane lipoprotein SlyB